MKKTFLKSFSFGSESTKRLVLAIALSLFALLLILFLTLPVIFEKTSSLPDLGMDEYYRLSGSVWEVTGDGKAILGTLTGLDGIEDIEFTSRSEGELVMHVKSGRAVVSFPLSLQSEGFMLSDETFIFPDDDVMFISISGMVDAIACPR